MEKVRFKVHHFSFFTFSVILDTERLFVLYYGTNERFQAQSAHTGHDDYLEANYGQFR
ncbi:MAG: hypothetical protein Fur0021_21700 [Candidatus Promineifilaceae bacterium]